jgi:cell division protein ZipA
MAELRWVLLALGILVIAAVYLWGKEIPQRFFARLAVLRKSRPADPVRVEPAFDEPQKHSETAPDNVPQASKSTATAESIITVRLFPSGHALGSDKVILALRAAGLKHGRYGIFHRHEDEFDDEARFSVANLTEPGSFDLTNLTEKKIPGMSFFMVLPGKSDPVARFDDMVATARELARELEGELRDENGSSWSIQRERYVREEIIEYCHSLDKTIAQE